MIANGRIREGKKCSSGYKQLLDDFLVSKILPQAHLENSSSWTEFLKVMLIRPFSCSINTTIFHLNLDFRASGSWPHVTWTNLPFISQRVTKTSPPISFPWKKKSHVRCKSLQSPVPFVKNTCNIPSFSNYFVWNKNHCLENTYYN